MAAPHPHNHIRPYVSGWCEGTQHERCKGNYAGTACCCGCHQRAASATESASGGAAR